MAGLGRKVFTRETLGSAEVNGYLMDQAVMHFASASARSAAIPSPSNGMVSILDTVRVPEVFYDGSWRALGSGAWTVGTPATDVNYNAGITGTRTALTSMTTPAISVPSGRTLEAWFRAPHVKVNASGTVFLYLMANATQLDEGIYGTGGSTTFGVPGRLDGAIAGPGNFVLKVEANGAGGGGFVQGQGLRAPQILYRVV